MVRKYVTLSISLLLALLFLYAAINKLVDFKRLSSIISHIVGNRPLGIALSILLAVSESTVGLLLLIPRSRRLGLIGSFSLMVLFTGYIQYLFISPNPLPCACGGILQHMPWRTHLYFNLFFLLLSFIGLNLRPGTDGSSGRSNGSPLTFHRLRT